MELEGFSLELPKLEELVMKLEAVEKNIEGYKSKQAELEKTLEEYKRKSDVEKRFHELAGLPYEDRSAELQEQLKALKAEYEGALSERDRLREEILKGISNIVIPVEKESAKTSRQEVTFPYRGGTKYQAIISFIEKELGFGHPPVYVTFTPEGIKVVGVGNELSAMHEVVKVIESLRAKARKQLDLILKPKGPSEGLLEEEELPLTVKLVEKSPPKPKSPEVPPPPPKKKAGLLNLLKKSSK